MDWQRVFYPPNRNMPRGSSAHCVRINESGGYCRPPGSGSTPGRYAAICGPEIPYNVLSTNVTSPRISPIAWVPGTSLLFIVPPLKHSRDAVRKSVQSAKRAGKNPRFSFYFSGFTLRHRSTFTGFASAGWTLTLGRESKSRVNRTLCDRL